MGIVTTQQNRIKMYDTQVKAKLQDIDLLVTWGHIARDYFNKSASWLYHKFDGIDGNGGVGGFTPEEVEQLKGALIDVSIRLRKAADRL